MSIQAQLSVIAARGLEAIDNGTTLLPTPVAHCTEWTEEFEGACDGAVIRRTGGRKPRTLFPANNY